MRPLVEEAHLAALAAVATLADAATLLEAIDGCARVACEQHVLRGICAVVEHAAARVVAIRRAGMPCEPFDIWIRELIAELERDCPDVPEHFGAVTRSLVADR